jgi:hypothetical protein
VNGKRPTLNVQRPRFKPAEKGKGQVEHDLALLKPLWHRPPADGVPRAGSPCHNVYFEYPVVELVDVDIGASFFCAQAPKLKALAKTATIMIAFKNFNVISPSFLAGCCRSSRRGC